MPVAWLYLSDAMDTFVAIDFETATARRDSACALGLAAGRDGRVVLSRTYLIRPPSPRFTFSGLHGLTWKDVRDAPSFAELWPTLHAWIDNAAFLAAHNASFDRSVLHACCARYGLRPPREPFTCTVQLARTQWGIRPTKLPDVCRRLRIPLRHHDAGADATACARIVLAARAEGWRPRRSAARLRTRNGGKAAPLSGTARRPSVPSRYRQGTLRPETGAMVRISSTSDPMQRTRPRWRAVTRSLWRWWRRLRDPA